MTNIPTKSHSLGVILTKSCLLNLTPNISKKNVLLIFVLDLTPGALILKYYSYYWWQLEISLPIQHVHATLSLAAIAIWTDCSPPLDPVHRSRPIAFSNMTVMCSSVKGRYSKEDLVHVDVLRKISNIDILNRCPVSLNCPLVLTPCSALLKGLD